MPIQILLIAAVVTLLGMFALRWNTTRTRAWKRIAFVLFCLLNIYAVLRPGDTSRVANSVGVGRGTDLVLYLLVVGVTALALNTYMRFRGMEQRLTDVARAMALHTAYAPDTEGTPPARTPASRDRTPTRTGGQTQ